MRRRGLKSSRHCCIGNVICLWIIIFRSLSATFLCIIMRGNEFPCQCWLRTLLFVLSYSRCVLPFKIHRVLRGNPGGLRARGTGGVKTDRLLLMWGRWKGWGLGPVRGARRRTKCKLHPEYWFEKRGNASKQIIIVREVACTDSPPPAKLLMDGEDASFGSQANYVLCLVLCLELQMASETLILKSASVISHVYNMWERFFHHKQELDFHISIDVGYQASQSVYSFIVRIQLLL